tara:strand:- start:56 stop:298 length:243 start_codon:yes stop_codon:yes gene_type:complete
MEQKIKERSKIKSVIAEIAHDLGINKRLVRQVLILTFKEIAITLILKGRPVMIRRFVKFVVAAATIRKVSKQNKKEKECN